jgi:sporulation protein YlmC with PRC-barrel domain
VEAGTVTGASSLDSEGRVRHPFIIAVVAASFAVLPARIPIADEIHQPGAAPSTSPEHGYNEVLPYWTVQRVLGTEILSSTGEHLGRVVDVLVDQGGQIRGAVIDFGGFLGVGSRKVVVDWAALHFASDDHDDRIILDLTRDQIRTAPEYETGRHVTVLTAVPKM